MLSVQPQVSQIHNLVGMVPSFPVSSNDLVSLAEEKHAGTDVKQFLQAFPDGEMFLNRDDLLARTEQVALMNQEQDQPQERWLAPEED